MRTRFLSIDHSASSTLEALETLDFLRLQPPHLPPSYPSTSQILSCFDGVSALIISLDIETLPIGEALSKFFSDVVPRSTDVETGHFASSPSSSAEVPNPKDKNEVFCNGMEENGFEAIEFEMPELDLLLDNACFFEEEKIDLYAEVAEATNNLDMLNPELMLRRPFEILKSMCSVDDICPEYHMEHDDFLSEEAACAQDQVHLHNSTFPVLEVDEIGLGIASGIPREDGFFLLVNVEPEVRPQKEEVIVDAQELLGSLDIDILDYLADHSLSKQCIEAMPSHLTFSLGMDLISIIELPLSEGNLAFQQGILDDSSFCSVIKFYFEEIQFLEFDSYQFLEIFSNSLTVCQAETCEQMFVEESYSGNFNELIVSHELTLVDDSFKSLPIPILSDPEKIRSQFLFVEEMLAGLKPKHPSTSDGIYLDWHFLEEDYSNCDKYSFCWKQVLEINNYSIDSDVEPLNDWILILDIVFYGETQNEESVEDNKETLNILSPHVPAVTASFNDFASGKLLNAGCGKHGDAGVLSGINAGKGSTLAEPVLPFNDLNFFLNPRAATAGRSSKPAVKVFDGSAVFPDISCTNQTTPCAATAIQPQHRDLKFHEVKLASTELRLADNFHEEKCDMGSSRAGDKVEAFCTRLPVPHLPSAVEPERIHPSVSSFLVTIVIVNTKNCDKEMIISRRSTYQKILAMEKQGAQVVERDLKLPVDVIISAAICLVWYDCKNIGKKASAPDESSSCLAMCIENIAANVLTSLSFAFSSCILVFEGESSFLAAVMESSDELYAAAASLNIDLQLFCSYSSELTEEIILSCIGCAPTRHIYPKMPESETLAESFLTTFPSINPLSAHAILSSVHILVEFLEWSQEHRVCASQKYHVPDESMNLFGTLCKYGEREDSRSAMTDCSSSVSSAPDSENCQGKTDSVRKKGKYIESPHKTARPVDNLFDFELLKQFPDGSLNLPIITKAHDTWLSGVEEMFDEIEKPGASVSGKVFSRKQGSGSSRGAEISNEIKKPSWPLDDNLFGPQDAIDMALMNKLDFRRKNESANLREDLIGEVIDIRDRSSLDQDFPSFANSLDFSCLVSQTAKDSAVENVRTARTLSFSRSSHPTFPTAAEISSDSNIPVTDYSQSLREGYNRHTDANFSKHELPLRHQEKLSEDHSIHRTATNSPWLSVQEDTRQHGGTPLSKAVQSAQPHQGSPWTIEFLNRIKERSRSRQRSLPHGTSPLCFAYSGNVSKVIKRKSPSILDFYKYQGGSTPRKINEQKRQKRSTQPSSLSKKDKSSASFGPSWTPLDKKARQTLSFSMGGGGGQSKLVWSDKDAETVDRRFYN